MSVFGWPVRETWWRRAWGAIRQRVPHVHLWRSRTVRITTNRQRYDAEERSCRCGDCHVIGTPPPGPSPILRMTPALEACAKALRDSGISINEPPPAPAAPPEPISIETKEA